MRAAPACGGVCAGLLHASSREARGIRGRGARPTLARPSGVADSAHRPPSHRRADIAHVEARTRWSRWIEPRLAALDRTCERLRDDARFQRHAFLALLALRGIALVAMYFHEVGLDSVDLEQTLFLRFVTESRSLGFASGAYQLARGYWHGPFSYAFYAALLEGPGATLAAGRAISVAVYLVAGIVWYLNVRLLFPRGLHLVGLAAFLVGPSWHTIQIRPYALYLLLVICAQYFAAVLVARPEALARLLATVGLAASLALGFANHLYGGLAFASTLLLAVFALVARREPGTAAALVGALVAAVSITAPWFGGLLAQHFAGTNASTALSGAALFADPLGRCLARAGARNALFIVSVALIAAAWWRRRVGPLAITLALACAALAGFPFVVAWIWVAHLGDRLRTRVEGAWIVPLLFGSLPCSLEFCSLEDNYLTGFRNLPLLLLADLLVRGSRPRVRLFAAFALGAYLVQLSIWTFAGGPFGGDSPH